jgi:polyisoprenoid-binding protein YceI
MRRSLLPLLTVLLALPLFAAPAHAADRYKIDPAHSAVVFRVGHMGIGIVFGRFNEIAGSFVVDRENPANCSLAAGILADSVDTNQADRDKHLRSPDFFNVKEFPRITLKSTKVEQTDDGYKVTGDLTLHGVTRSITFNLTKVGEGKDPRGTQRIGFYTEFTVKRTDHGMNFSTDMVSDEVTLMISVEGIKQE